MMYSLGRYCRHPRRNDRRSRSSDPRAQQDTLTHNNTACVKQVRLQLPTSADNVALLAFAAACRAAVRRAAAAPGGGRYRSISPARRAHSSKPAARCCNGQ